MDSKPQHLYYDRKPVSDVSASLQCYPAKEFQSPTRSTVSLLSLVKDGRETLKSLLVELQMNADSDLHLEFTVDPPKGKGRPSQTDLMVKWQAETLAVEAKWTEPRYETVADRIRRENTENRRQVMTGWLDLLQPHAARVLHVDDFPDAVYQMVHRAASACYKSERPRLAYLHFTPDPSGKGATSAQYQSDLEHLQDLLGNPAGFSFHLIEVEIRPTAAFEQIRNLPKASAETARTVCAALQDGPLFEFTIVRSQAVKGVSSI
ncbi:MAG: hypothetical protein MUO89_05875 [Dehalococcoidia bacterium]|nr:hypothetical protein [Dehalococcoidia bacterium]